MIDERPEWRQKMIREKSLIEAITVMHKALKISSAPWIIQKMLSHLFVLVNIFISPSAKSIARKSSCGLQHPLPLVLLRRPEITCCIKRWESWNGSTGNGKVKWCCDFEKKDTSQEERDLREGVAWCSSGKVYGSQGDQSWDKRLEPTKKVETQLPYTCLMLFHEIYSSTNWEKRIKVEWTNKW